MDSAYEMGIQADATRYFLSFVQDSSGGGYEEYDQAVEGDCGGLSERASERAREGRIGGLTVEGGELAEYYAFIDAINPSVHSRLDGYKALKIPTPTTSWCCDAREDVDEGRRVVDSFLKYALGLVS